MRLFATIASTAAVRGAGLTLLVATAPLAASAQELDELGYVGDWHIFHLERPDGTHFCGASLYDNAQDAWVHVDRISNEPDVVLTVYATGAPQLKPGAWSPIEVALGASKGGSNALEVSGVGRSTTSYNGVSFYGREGVLEQFMGADTVMVTFGGFSTPSLSINGASEALGAVDECAARYF